ncbi:MAG: hypothetical protein CMJ93_02345 [Planctomycetes bacterium]|nr:hypothetical protein [Planctomycetota bacterium]
MQVAKRVGSTEHEFVNNLSRHRLPDPCSFSHITTLHEEAKRHGLADFVGSHGNSMYFSARPAPPKPAKSKKRSRDEAEGEVEASVDQIMAKIPNAYRLDDRLRAILVRLKRDVCGSYGEEAVQSIGVETKKLSPTDAEPCNVVSARVAPGVAVSVSRLKASLGDAWKDGVLTLEETVFGVGGSLTLSEEAEAAKTLGANSGILVVTSMRRLGEIANAPSPNGTC